MKKSWIKEALLVVPRIAMLLPKLIADERVPTSTKLALAGLLVYLATPWDIIPDFIPGLGQLDDTLAILLFLDGLFNQVEDAVLLEHWTGEIETLRRVQSLSRIVSRWTPKQLKKFLFGRAAAAGKNHMQQSTQS